MQLLNRLPLHWITAGLMFLYLILMVHMNTVPVDAADGLQHFTLVEYSWTNPQLLFDHWGKPLFTLLASPFAQGGYIPYLYFNLLVFLATCLVAYRLCDHWNVSKIIKSIFPIVLVCIPDYSYCILGGLTEPLFGLLIVTALLLIHDERWWQFALLASLAPFTRSEGMIVVVMALVVLIYKRQWKPIPLLASGFLIYAIAGALAGHSFFWYFTEDPYTGSAFYGNGPWSHYLVTWGVHFGKLTVLLTIPAIIGWVLLLRSDQGKRFIPLAAFGLVIYGGIVIIHSYLWANGLKSSLGLTRLATLGIPGYVALLLIGLQQLSIRVWNWAPTAGFVIVFVLGAIMIKRNHYPLHPSPFEELVFNAADYVKQHENKVGTVYYFHPLIAWRLGVNQFSDNPKYKQKFFQIDQDIKTLKKGDVIIRDSQFGSGEQGLKMEQLQKYPWLVRVKSFYGSEYRLSYLGELESMMIYSVLDPSAIPTEKIEKQQADLPLKAYQLQPELEFIDLTADMKSPTISGQVTLELDFQIDQFDDALIFMGFSENESGTIQTVPFDQKQAVHISLKGQPFKHYKMYFHNPNKTKRTLVLKKAEWVIRTEPGL